MILVKGNLLDTPVQIIAHQVNCLGVMGAGVAKAIKDEYPEVFIEYNTFVHDYVESSPAELLGKCLSVYCKEKIMLNLFGQVFCGRGKVLTDYDALHKAMRGAIRELRREYMREDGIQITIAIPYKIGCGLAGGDWNIVSELLEKIEKEENALFIAYKL